MTFSCRWLRATAAPSLSQYVFCMPSTFILVMIFLFTALPSESCSDEKLPPYFAIWFLFFLSQVMIPQSSATYVSLITFTSPNNRFHFDFAISQIDFTIGFEKIHLLFFCDFTLFLGGRLWNMFLNSVTKIVIPVYSVTIA